MPRPSSSCSADGRNKEADREIPPPNIILSGSKPVQVARSTLPSSLPNCSKVCLAVIRNDFYFLPLTGLFFVHILNRRHRNKLFHDPISIGKIPDFSAGRHAAPLNDDFSGTCERRTDTGSEGNTHNAVHACACSLPEFTCQKCRRVIQELNVARPATERL